MAKFTVATMSLGRHARRAARAAFLVRYAVKYDRHQTALATDILAKNQCFVPKTVLRELVWVLSSPAGYDLSRETVADRLYHILGLPNAQAEDAPRVAEALAWHAAGMDFAARTLCIFPAAAS